MRGPICSSSSSLVEVGRDQHRALGLVALVDQGVELLQHPVGAFLGAEVVDVEEVDRGQALEEGEVGVAAGLGVVGLADPRQQFRQRVDRDRVGRPPAPPWRPASPASSCRCRCRPSARGRGPRRGSASEVVAPSYGTHLDHHRVDVGAPAAGRRRRRGSGRGITEETPRLRPRRRRWPRHSQGAGDVSRGRGSSRSRRRRRAGRTWPRKGSLRAIAASERQAPRRVVGRRPSPAGCSIGGSWPEWSANLGKRSRKTSFLVPIGPFLCLAMIRSARPSGSSSGSR